MKTSSRKRLSYWLSSKTLIQNSWEPRSYLDRVQRMDQDNLSHLPSILSHNFGKIGVNCLFPPHFSYRQSFSDYSQIINQNKNIQHRKTIELHDLVVIKQSSMWRRFLIVHCPRFKFLSFILQFESLYC